VTVAWTPIEYQPAGGRYEVATGAAVGGPFTPHGFTPDLAASSYTVDGLEPGQTYYLRVRTRTPAGVEQPQPLTSTSKNVPVATASEERILLIVVFGGDNNLSIYADGLLNRLAQGTAVNPAVTVLALMDRLGPDNTDLHLIRNGAMTRETDFPGLQGAQELDSADPTVLADFLNYARTTYPAEQTILSLVGHGVGLAPDLAWLPPVDAGEQPTPQPGIPPLPKEKDFTPTDVTSGSYLSTPALGRALAAATANGAQPFDLLFFDQCFAGNLDVLYEVRNAARVFIASPNYAWLTAPYSRYVPELSPARAPEEMANAVINVYQRSLNNEHPNAIFWLRSEDIVTVAGAVDELAAALLTALDAGDGDAIRLAALGSNYVDTTQCGRQNLKLGPPDELLGASSFATALKQNFDAASGVSTAADQLLAALENVTGNARVGSPYIEPDETWDYTDTLTILAPLRANSPPGIAWRASLYRADLAGQEATWTPDPSQTVVINSVFSYVQDGRWDEFIAAWYDADLIPTVGEWCSYTPPALVVDGEVETLDLAASVGPDLALTWSSPVDDEAVTYGIFSRQPNDISWNLLTYVSAPQTDLTLADLPGGGYRFLVAALNADGLYFAKTDYVQVDLPEPATDLYLPFLFSR
ncbi:MAG: hypothetical protein KDD78_00135, partial [Caldilineaceae bacterium]|nr:hypothetical protein [Caldilineaceae bacterium]